MTRKVPFILLLITVVTFLPSVVHGWGTNNPFSDRGNQINDAKGNGDLDYTWSADKLFDQLALKAPLPLISTPVAFVDGDTSPDVSGGTFFITANTGATTIADFDCGGVACANGKFIAVMVNDVSNDPPFTSLDFTSSGLEGATSDTSMTTGKMFFAIYSTVDNQWHCNLFPDSFALSISIPNRNADTLTDTSTPHDLAANESRGFEINNYAAAPGARQFNMRPAGADAPNSQNMIFRLGLAQNFTLMPCTNGAGDHADCGAADDVIYLETPDHARAALAAGEAVVNTAPAIGAKLTCMDFQTGAATWAWDCWSNDDNFNEETP